MATIDKIITKVNSKFGAPMGRSDKGSMKYCKDSDTEIPDTDKKVYNQRVVLNSGGYDKGGAYWGIGSELRVMYTKDLSFIHFYRT